MPMKTNHARATACRGVASFNSSIKLTRYAAVAWLLQLPVASCFPWPSAA